MDKVVLLGENIEHSRSPLILNSLFRRYDIPYHYELEPLDGRELGAAIERMRAGGYRGANITSPYKERASLEVDRLEPSAAAIGAINTIVIESGEAIGHNTDIDGFAATLDSEPLLHTGFSAAILGTGGAARAAAFALRRFETLTRLTIYSRSESRAIDLAMRMADPRIGGGALERFVAADLIVQATPVGLPGNEHALLDAGRLAGGRVFYEMIYSPPLTAQSRLALQAGLRVVNGERMLVEQALRAFTLWTGIVASSNDLPDDLFSRGQDRSDRMRG
jgi:shikimate dehydrogenase